MRYLHLQLLEQLTKTAELKVLAERIFLAYIQNPQADFDRDIKPLVKYYTREKAVQDEVVQKVEEVELNKEKILQTYENNQEKGRSENQGKKTDWFIRDLKIKNFRKYGDLEGDEHFSLDLKGEDINSLQGLILVGGNGVGKSSLYGAIEDITTNSVSEAILRDVNKDAYTKREQEKSIELYTNIGTFHNYDEFISCFANKEMNLLLCSENDIFELGKVAQSDDMLCWALITGYKEIYQLIRNLEQVSIEMKSAITTDKEKREENSLNLEKTKQRLEGNFRSLFFKKMGDQTLSQLTLKIKKLSEELNNFDPSSLNQKKVRNLQKLFKSVHTSIEEIFSFDEKLFKEGVREEIRAIIRAVEDGINTFGKLQSEISDSFKRNPLVDIDKKIKDLVAWGSQIESYIYQYFSEVYQPDVLKLTELERCVSEQENENLLSDHISLIDQYISELKKLLKDRLLKFYERSQSTIEEVMKFFEITSPDYKLEGDHSKQKMFFNIYNDKFPDKLWVPKIFYNNFRFKLFYMTLKVAAGIAYMEEYGAFPIVMDDIFYASDFYSRKRITDFFSSLIRFIQEKMKNRVQIICFTHDEVVFSAIRKAVVNSRETGHFIFGRLISPEMIETQKVPKGEKKNRNLYIRLYEC